MEETQTTCSRLLGRRAFVTGAGSGIGRASALRLAAEGAGVMCTDVREGSAVETADAIRRNDGTAEAVGCDVGGEEAVERAVEEAVTRLGGVDIVLANAGIASLGMVDGGLTAV